MNILMSYKSKYYNLCILVLILPFIFNTDISAQQKRDGGLPQEVMAWTISTMEPWPPNRYRSLNDAMIDNKIFIPLVFRGGIFPKLDYKFSRDSLHFVNPVPSMVKYKNKRNEKMFSYYLFRKKLDDLAYKDVMLKDPKNFKYTLSQLPETIIRPESIEAPNRSVSLLEARVTPIVPEEVNPILKFIPDRRYWTSSFSSDIKFSQNKTSSNWYKGEINNINIYTNTITSYNYSKGKLSLANTLSTTFTINNAPSDTLRKYTIGSDELRFRSNFGLKAVGFWNYSSSAEFITSMGNKYVTNTEMKNSAFLSPYTVNVGVGMTYIPKPKFKKKDRSLNLSLSLEPLSFKYMYSRDRAINLGAYFQADENGNYEYILKTFGSTITMTKTTQFSRNVSWYSRLYYFTNYERAIGEFENKLDIALSRYFSTTMYFYLRYDDGVTKKKESDTYLQINEMFSFGFSYKW